VIPHQNVIGARGSAVKKDHGMLHIRKMLSS